MNKKILFILNDLRGGGAEKVFVNIANGFKSHGLIVEMLLAENEGVYFDILSPDIPVHILGTKSLLGFMKKLPTFFMEKDYTHVFTAFDYISAATIITNKRLLYKFTSIATLHYHLPYQLSILPRANRIWLQMLNKYIIAKADKLVSVSNGVGKGFKEVVKSHNLQIKTIYNPVVEPNIYKLAEEEIEDAYKNMDYLITIGRLSGQKNQKNLLYAFRSVLRKKPTLHLLILGVGNKEVELRNICKELLMEENVHFMGFQTNPFKYLSRAKLFILSSDFEGLGNVIIEALALGINVVSTDCPSGPSEILDDEKYGWLAEVNIPEDLASKICMALENLKPASLLQKRSKLFEKDRIVNEYLELIDS